ncbi:MAG: hypothetical protein K0U86_05115 [Planctomycetes bacterium]|nr:hypothetical protein [Planctomycetota bacterium]MCH9724270.1 hypothetical protein [Planctomycetota bacterium]MCH9776686.1 hypothetical protein [Planctomycetota bacterium]MCH9790076.1 hypothetical protein [Planctomycetota bacterium]
MDTFENGTLAEEQMEMVMAKCWECGEKKLCYEHLVCCTGTRFHTCPECRKEIESRGDDFELPVKVT